MVSAEDVVFFITQYSQPITCIINNTNDSAKKVKKLYKVKCVHPGTCFVKAPVARSAKNTLIMKIINRARVFVSTPKSKRCTCKKYHFCYRSLKIRPMPALIKTPPVILFISLKTCFFVNIKTIFSPPIA